MSETNLNAGELETKILRKLYESTTGTAGTDRSEAFPTAIIFDAMNETFEEVFNGGKNQKNIRQEEYDFDLIADVALDGDLTAGDTSIVLTDSSTLPSSGRVLIGNELVDFSANDNLTTLTCGATDVGQDHVSGIKVRPLYVLPSGIDKENHQALYVNGIPYDPVDYTAMLDSFEANNNKYSVYSGYIVLPQNTGTNGVLFIYTPSVTRVTLITETFSLIPNNFRVPLIVNGSVGKLMMEDGQDGYEFYYRPPKYKGDKGGGLFYDNLRKFYANYGRQGNERNRKRTGSIYDGVHNGRAYGQFKGW